MSFSFLLNREYLGIRPAKPIWLTGISWYRLMTPNPAGRFLSRQQWCEHLIYELADFRVEIQLVPNGTWPVIAAPVLSEQSGSTFRYQKNAARNFTWSASPDYQVLPAYAQNTLVLGYIFNEHTAAGQDAVEYIRQALEAYNVMFGYYPLECMTIIESDFPDGMEYDGLFFSEPIIFHLLFRRHPQAVLCALSAHETAHQWWYRVVSNNQALEPWMDEALCTYSELIIL